MSDLERLYELQTVDSSLAQLPYRRAHLDERLAFNAAHSVTESARAALDANIAHLGTLEAKYAAIEKATKGIDAKVVRLEGQMKTIVVTREAEAMQREIATLRSERDAHDEAGLALLDESEVLGAQADVLRGTLNGAQAAQAALAVTLAIVDGELDNQKIEWVTHRAQLVGTLPSELVAQYEQMRPTFKGVAVARLAGTRCTGCHMDLSRVEIEALRTVAIDAVAECPQCARILVRESHLH